jgi:hypothetical protein
LTKSSLLSIFTNVVKVRRMEPKETKESPLYPSGRALAPVLSIIFVGISVFAIVIISDAIQSDPQVRTNAQVTHLSREANEALQQALAERTTEKGKGSSPRTGKPSKLEPSILAAFQPNIRATVNDLAQQEPALAINPGNPQNIIIATKDERSGGVPHTDTKEVWMYTSQNGGQTWTQQKAPIFGSHGVKESDPVVIFRDDGRAYASYLGYNDNDFYTDTGVYITQSTDNGLSWGNTALAVQEKLNPNDPTHYAVDKDWLAVDNNPSSPFYHRMYLAWLEFGACSDCIHFVYSTDEGATWSNRNFQLSSGTTQQYPMPVVLSNGNLLVSWAEPGTGKIFYRISTNGGVSFGTQAIAATMNTNLSMNGRTWRLANIPSTAAARNPIAGQPDYLVTVWNDGRNNSSRGVDIYYARSTNGGTTWGAPARLNDDVNNSVKQQAEPWVTASPDGHFHAIWYDEREDTDPNNINFHIYYAQSTDYGATWSSNIRISDATSDLNNGDPGWGSPGNIVAGDYIAVAATNSNVYAAWTDTRSGTQEDIYITRNQPGGMTPTPTPTPTTDPCRANINGNGAIDVGDFNIYVREQGWDCRQRACTADINCSGIVTIADFGILKANFGRQCPAVTPAPCVYP